MAGKRPTTRAAKSSSITPVAKKAKVEGESSVRPAVIEISEGDWQERQVAIGFSIDLEWLKNNNEKTILTILADNGWEPLVNQSLPVYPELMREFYKHMTIDEDYNVYTKVRGRPYAFDMHLIGEILGVQPVGETPYSETNVLTEEETVKVKEFIEDATGEKAGNTLIMQHGNLEADVKITAEFVKRILLPRGPKRGSSNTKETLLVCMLDEGVKINFPLLMIKHMAYVKNFDKSHHLPYGPQITKLFQWYAVNLDAMKPDPELQKVWNETVLKKMFINLEDGQYSYYGRKAEGGEVQRELKLDEIAEGSMAEGDDGQGDDTSVSLLRQMVKLQETLVFEIQTQRAVFESLISSEMAKFRDSLKEMLIGRVPADEDEVPHAESVAPPADPKDHAVSPSPVFQTPQSKPKSK